MLEFGGGALLALGLLTPVASTMLIAVMTAAIISVHYPKVCATRGGYEYNLVLANVAFALAAIGPGNWSLDHALSLSMHGVLWAIGALVVGLVGGAGCGQRTHGGPPRATRGNQHADDGLTSR